MTFVQGGTTANYTGTVLEKYAISRLEERGYTYIQPDKFTPSRILKQPFFTRKFNVCKTIYGTKQFCDFILYHPHKWPNNLIIECKWQQSGGSVDEKFPYLVLNITMKYEIPTIVLIDGHGYRKGAETWLRNQAGNGNFKHVFSMSEFSTWANKGNI